jgi:type II secretory pathway pseudopilin PulG
MIEDMADIDRQAFNQAIRGAVVVLAISAAAALAALAASAVQAQGAEQAVQSVAVERTAFRITLADGRTLSGPDLVGATLTMADGKGGQVPVRIDAVQSDPKDPSGEITLYAFSVVDAATGEWRNLCQPDPDGERWGFPVAFGMDGEPVRDGSFSIVCTAGARAKCLRFGYKPWGPAVEGVPARALYDACVHMVRADYCGDGVGTTRDGTMIDLYDRFGIQKDEPLPGMRFEAGWGPQGAVCVAHTRIPENATLDDVLAACPRLREAPTGADCTEASAAGALLFNKSF